MNITKFNFSEDRHNSILKRFEFGLLLAALITQGLRKPAIRDDSGGCFTDMNLERLGVIFVPIKKTDPVIVDDGPTIGLRGLGLHQPHLHLIVHFQTRK